MNQIFFLTHISFSSHFPFGNKIVFLIFIMRYENIMNLGNLMQNKQYLIYGKELNKKKDSLNYFSIFFYIYPSVFFYLLQKHKNFGRKFIFLRFMCDDIPT